MDAPIRAVSFKGVNSLRHSFPTELRMSTASLSHHPTEQSPSPAPPLRVLHVVNGEFFAGAERVQDLLALKLPQHGYEVGFACIKPRKFPTARMSQNSPLYSLPMRGKLDLRTPRDVARLVRDEGYALIHAHTPRSLLVGRIAAALSGVPLVYHIHSQTTTEVDRRWACRWNALTERLCLTGASAVIAVSATARYFARRQGVAEQIIHLVPNGIPTSATPPIGHSPPAGAWTLGTVALFRPRKGLEVLLEALSLLRRGGQPVRLRAIGPFETEEYEREVHSLADRLGICDGITWTGFTRDVAAELARLDLFVMPSLLAEGMPMVLLEAMSAGVPIVASNVDGVTDVLGGDGRCGLLVPPGDAQTLADTVLQLIRGEYDTQAWRVAAAARQAEQFSDESMARGVAEVYRQVLSKLPLARRQSMQAAR